MVFFSHLGAKAMSVPRSFTVSYIVSQHHHGLSSILIVSFALDCKISRDAYTVPRAVHEDTKPDITMSATLCFGRCRSMENESFRKIIRTGCHRLSLPLMTSPKLLGSRGACMPSSFLFEIKCLGYFRACFAFVVLDTTRVVSPERA
jgi:hypothetical protein